jgi:hypothetical protein
VLLGRSDGLDQIDAHLAALLTGDTVRELVGLIPDELLAVPGLDREGDPPMHRARYHEYLAARLEAPRAFHQGAVEAREVLRRSTPRARSARR